jgi:NAD(P)H-hydrate epimerase
MAGAAALAALGAYRSGAGLVHVFVPEPIYPIVAGLVPHATFTPYPGRRFDEPAADLALKTARADCWVIGPGLDRHECVAAGLGRLLGGLHMPVVLDADALVLLGDRRPAGRAVLTPHPGEARRLLGRDVRDRQADAVEIAQRFRAVAVLKGHRTVVTDGERVYVNPTGNPGLATGGTGDVLAGMIAALIGQGYDPFEAACAGVWLHGLAGDIAARRTGEHSLVAPDVVEAIPQAFSVWRRRRR